MQIDRTHRRITLSIKALEVQEEKQAMEEYGSTDSGASLGDILGAALDRKTQEEAARAAEAEAQTDAEPEPEAEAKSEAEADSEEASEKS